MVVELKAQTFCVGPARRIMDSEGIFEVAMLRNPRHERFCELVVCGVRPSDAYNSIGYSAKGATQADC